MKDDLGDRMKYYEEAQTKSLMPLLPTFARVDGRAFHTFTKGMTRPYDAAMSKAMIGTAAFLAKETNACLTYTQSDEITLAWLQPTSRSEIWFNLRHSKMVSQIAALATLRFYELCLELMPERASKRPTFDGRVWQVPSKAEGCNVFLWRELDAIKNSVTMAARSVYSDKEIYKKNTAVKRTMLNEKGIEWDDYPSFFKRGVYIQKRTERSPFSTEDIEKLPKGHAARKNPDLIVERSVWRELSLPIFATIENKEAVVFEGAEAIVKDGK